MTIRSLIPGLAALLALVAAAGCGGDAPSLSSELDDSSYRYGQQLEHQGNWDEALTAYLKVIDRRGDGAPESNLNAGLIYLNHIRDPISAIYHFRSYLELEPNSKQAVFVKGMIDSAKREFARSLPGQPLESESEHLGVEEQVERLQREIDELKAENTALRAGSPVPVTHSSTIDLSCDSGPEGRRRGGAGPAGLAHPLARRARASSRPPPRSRTRRRRARRPRRSRGEAGGGRRRAATRWSRATPSSTSR